MDGEIIIKRAADPKKLADYRKSRKKNIPKPKLDKMGRKFTPKSKGMTEETAKRITDERIARRLRGMF